MWGRTLLCATACSMAACGPKTLELPEQLVDRAATCGIVTAAEARAATTDIKAELPFDAMGRILHFTLLGGAANGTFSAENAASVQKRMTDLQDQVTGGKWQDLVPACRAAFPPTAVAAPELPGDRAQAQLGCYELGEYLRSALEEQGKYDNELGEYRQLRDKLDATVGPALRARAANFEAQQAERHKALAAIAQSGPPIAVMNQCLKRFG